MRKRKFHVVFEDLREPSAKFDDAIVACSPAEAARKFVSRHLKKYMVDQRGNERSGILFPGYKAGGWEKFKIPVRGEKWVLARAAE